jgi:hypothetical protein
MACVGDLDRQMRGDGVGELGEIVDLVDAPTTSARSSC